MWPEEIVGPTLGNYSILRPIGRGGMATVFLAKDKRLQREVAIKVFQPRPHDNETFLRRFAREARVVARLDHPNILSVYDYGEQDGIAYFVMPHLTHGSLRERLQQQKVMSIPDALNITVQILRALQYAHERNFIHRDIKPGNILFKDELTPVLSDFGLVKFIDEDGTNALDVSIITQTGDVSIMGTPQYMAPEQIQGRPGRASDVYSIGAVLYEMLTGAPPFTAESAIVVLSKHLYEQPHPMNTLNPSIPFELDQVVQRALAKQEVDRYPTPAAFIEALTEEAQKLQTNLNMADPQTVMLPEAETKTPMMTTDPYKDGYRTVYHSDLTEEGTTEQHIIAQPPGTTKSKHSSRLWTISIAICIAAVLFAATCVWYVQTQHSSVLTVKSSATPTARATAVHKAIVAVATLPDYDTSCPPDEQMRKPVLVNLTNRGSDPQVVYYSHFYDSINNRFSGSFIRYSVASGSKAILLDSNTFSIDQAVLSPDKQWILFSTSVSGQRAKLQLLRIDGKGIQTLYCAPEQRQISKLSWSPFDEIGMGRIFFETTISLEAQATAQVPNQTQAYQLDLQNSKLTQETPSAQNANWGSPIGWADNKSLYLESPDMSIYLYTFSNVGKAAQMELIHQGTNCDSYSQSAASGNPDLFMSHCNGFGNHDCSGENCSSSGPSTITDLKTNALFYTNKDLAIVAINNIGNGKFLALVKNVNQTVESPDNGLYLIDQDSHISKIRKDDGTTFFFPDQSDLNIYCSSQDHCSYYALRTGSPQAVGANQLFFGTTDGKALTQISHSQNTSLDIAGWTQI